MIELTICIGAIALVLLTIFIVEYKEILGISSGLSEPFLDSDFIKAKQNETTKTNDR